MGQPTLERIAPPAGVTVAPADEWVLSLDHEAFKRDVQELGQRLERGQGEDDVRHLQRICLWSNALGVLGLLTMWLPVNPVTVAALSLWTFSRWTIIAHHTGHGGYNRADKTGFFSSRGFAQV
jgi:fatty acid desaturase